MKEKCSTKWNIAAGTYIIGNYATLVASVS